MAPRDLESGGVPSARVRPVRRGAVSDSHDSNAPTAIDHLIDDPVGTYAIGAEALETPLQLVSGFGIAGKDEQRVLDCVDVRPGEIEEVATSPPRQDEAGQ